MAACHLKVRLYSTLGPEAFSILCLHFAQVLCVYLSLCYVWFLVCVMCRFLVCVMCSFSASDSPLRGSVGSLRSLLACLGGHVRKKSCFDYPVNSIHIQSQRDDAVFRPHPNRNSVWKSQIQLTKLQANELGPLLRHELFAPLHT